MPVFLNIFISPAVHVRLAGHRLRGGFCGRTGSVTRSSSAIISSRVDFRNRETVIPLALWHKARPFWSLWIQSKTRIETLSSGRGDCTSASDKRTTRPVGRAGYSPAGGAPGAQDSDGIFSHPVGKNTPTPVPPFAIPPYSGGGASATLASKSCKRL